MISRRKYRTIIRVVDIHTYNNKTYLVHRAFYLVRINNRSMLVISLMGWSTRSTSIYRIGTCIHECESGNVKRVYTYFFFKIVTFTFQRNSREVLPSAVFF